ncbi:phage antirepressor KilAC domain-containing protein [Brevibacillus nitrificans]|uniref:phage antirepressor KilAC domain-containing protein n=1 Tax=Brevibacillus nitrificans TaxID=651560 RepID=UPI002E1A6F0F|nr:phage antirepressor KilAC domain-containing protein [Brevibacillus nitrificans]
MNTPQIFNHQMFGGIPVIIVEGVEWFGSSEAANAIGFTNPRAAIAHHVDKEDVTVHDTPTSGGIQAKKYVNESGLYGLIFGAAKQGNNPEIQAKAKEFKRWVTRVILPTIRRTGSFNMNDPQQLIALALVEAQKIIENKDQQIALMQPKAEFFDQVADSKDAIDIGTAAKVLKIPGIGRNKLFEFLRDEEILMTNNQPFQRYIDAGYFRVIEQKYSKPDGSTNISIKTLVYQKGLDYIRKSINKKLVKEAAL